MNTLKAAGSVNLNINNNDVNIQISDMPTISITSMDIFKEFGTEFKLTQNLKAKAATLNSSIQKLQEAENEDTKNKILTTLRSALTVAVLVGGILGSIAMSSCLPAVIGIGIATFITYTALCYYNATRIGIVFQFGDQYYEPFMAWIGGPFFPLYEGFGKVSRLEDQIQIQKEEIETNLTDLLSFFGHDQSDLEKTLSQEVDNLKASFEDLKKLRSNTPASKKEIQEKLEEHEKALSELRKAIEFSKNTPF